MTRAELMELAKKHGHQPGKRLSRDAATAIRTALRAHFQTKEGRRALEDAPRIHIAERGESKHREMSENDAVTALLEELDA